MLHFTSASIVSPLLFLLPLNPFFTILYTTRGPRIVVDEIYKPLVVQQHFVCTIQQSGVPATPASQPAMPASISRWRRHGSTAPQGDPGLHNVEAFIFANHAARIPPSGASFYAACCTYGAQA